MIVISKKGWKSLVELAVFIRGEHDIGNIDDTLMEVEMATIAEKVSAEFVDATIQSQRLTKSSSSPTTLRKTLSKLIHNNRLKSSFRVAKTGAHYLVLSGAEQNPAKGFWVIEIHMAKLCRSCREAVA